MALKSKCPRCQNTSFEIVTETPKGSAFKMLFTRCASCQTVVGVNEYYNTGALLETLAKKLNIDLFR